MVPVRGPAKGVFVKESVFRNLIQMKSSEKPLLEYH